MRRKTCSSEVAQGSASPTPKVHIIGTSEGGTLGQTGIDKGFVEELWGLEQRASPSSFAINGSESHSAEICFAFFPPYIG